MLSSAPHPNKLKNFKGIFAINGENNILCTKIEKMGVVLKLNRSKL